MGTEGASKPRKGSARAMAQPLLELNHDSSTNALIRRYRKLKENL
jgi:hypothetical protein